MNITDINQLINIRITWNKKKENPLWIVTIDGEECTLTMNNFPEEPLYTLKWRNHQLNFDDAPSCWIIPRQ